MRAFVHYLVPGEAKVRLSTHRGWFRVEVEMPLLDRLVIEIENAELELVENEDALPVEDKAVSSSDPGSQVRPPSIPRRKRRGVSDGTPDGKDKDHH